MSLLQIEDLSLAFPAQAFPAQAFPISAGGAQAGKAAALDQVSLSLERGEILGLVGGRGCGKTAIGLAIMRLLAPDARIEGGSISYDGIDLLALPEREMGALRGAEMGMIFQAPRQALAPGRRVGAQLADVLARHQGLGPAAAAERAVRLMAELRIPEAERRSQAYPFELSDALCQRVLAGMALAGRPRLLIADAPSAFQDPTVGYALLEWITTVVRRDRMGCLFLTDDLLLAARHCDRIAVMHAGQVVEVAETDTLMAAPRHPYTARLLNAALYYPAEDETVQNVAGEATSLDAVPQPGASDPAPSDGTSPLCRFQPCCTRATSLCEEAPLPMGLIAPAHQLRCRHPL